MPTFTRCVRQRSDQRTFSRSRSHAGDCFQNQPLFRPLCTSLIEKRLALKTPGYGSYMLARVQAFKALGVGFGEYRLFMPDCLADEANYFIRNRSQELAGRHPDAYMFQRANSAAARWGKIRLWCWL